MRKPVRILLTGGGSGGHIIPNLAVASAIKDSRPEANLLYVCSRGKLDVDLLKDSGIPFRPIFSGKWRRYFSWRNFIDPLFVFIGFLQSLIILIRFRPKVIFSKGGFVSLPVVLAGFLLRRRIILHESDSRMGIANRIASRLATVVCVAFPNLLQKGKKYRLTGNPIRPEITAGSAARGYELTGFSANRPVLLVWGGSQGADEINRLIDQDFEAFTGVFQLVHITGAGKKMARKDPRYIQFEYLDRELKHIYAMTDLVIGRAGANSLYELAYLQKPNIILPLGNADQMNNAHYFEEKGASQVFRKGDKLFDLARDLWQNKALRDEMRKSLKGISKQGGSEELVKIILDL